MALAVAIAGAFAFSVYVPAFAQAVPDQGMAPLIVTATRTPVAASDVLADNLVITADEIARFGQGSVADILRQKRGFELSRTGGAGAVTSMFIRGAANSQSVVLIDGVRVGSSTSGGAVWESIPLAEIDRIEVIYGPLSSVYGADAIGGVVQIFTKRGDGAPRATVSAGVGSRGARKLDAGISGSSEGERKLRYALSAATERDTGISASKPGAGSFTYNPDRDGYQKDSASGQLSLEWAKGHEAGATFLHSRLDAQYDGGAGFDHRTMGALNTVAVFSRDQILSNWSSIAQLAQSEDRADSTSAFGVSSFGTKQTHLSWQNNISIGNDVLQLLAEQREERVDTTTTDLNRKRTTDSFAASYQLQRGAHLANLAVRNDHTTQYGSNTTGSLAYGYRISPALRANASVGTSFRAPSFNELYFPGFGIESNAPEQGRNAEVGMVYETGASRLSATYYRNRITDLLVYSPVCPIEQATHQYGCAYNINTALLTGVTIGASQAIGNFTLQGSVDLQDPQDKTTGKLLPRRAQQHGTVSVSYKAGALNAGVEAILSGRRYDDAANRNRLGGYGLLNLYASYAFAPGWSAFGRWNNVLDKDYELARNYTTPGSNLFVGVRYGYK
ncbi:MAG: TonB-dependent receptor [Herminiimonas sp.]|nr:TonB-dependent receptor [Herminiimonas sp.]